MSRRGLPGHFVGKHGISLKDWRISQGKGENVAPKSSSAMSNDDMSNSGMPDSSMLNDNMSNSGMLNSSTATMTISSTGPDFSTILEREAGEMTRPTACPQPEYPAPTQQGYQMSGMGYAGLLKFTADMLDEIVDGVKQRRPDVYIKKCNLSETRARYIGDQIAQLAGPLDPKLGIALELAVIFGPTLVGIGIAVLPPSVLNKMTGWFNATIRKIEDRFRSEAQGNGETIPS